MRVLVVDDAPNIIREIQPLLERQGYQVETANNGVQALAKIHAHRPDLLVSDVMMPEMDGFELLSSIRRAPMLSDLPVIMLTSRPPEDTDPTVWEPSGSGLNWYLSKPFDPRTLMRLVNRLAREI